MQKIKHKILQIKVKQKQSNEVHVNIQKKFKPPCQETFISDGKINCSFFWHIHLSSSPYNKKRAYSLVAFLNATH